MSMNMVVLGWVLDALTRGGGGQLPAYAGGGCSGLYAGILR